MGSSPSKTRIRKENQAEFVLATGGLFQHAPSFDDTCHGQLSFDTHRAWSSKTKPASSDHKRSDHYVFVARLCGGGECLHSVITKLLRFGKISSGFVLAAF